jgi:alpha-N-arabinofuranosidase
LSAAFLGLALLAEPAAAPAAEQVFRNPVLPGGYPDPSICHDGEYWYLVNSTFEYFPGLPVHRSRDLVNWELVGHGLHRESQVTGAVNLVDVQSDGGIHAPTIRCGNGRFIIITTNVYLAPEEGAETAFVNFVVTADNAAGPWSEPQVIDGAPGIDPDLFFDDDGRIWYLGTHSPENPAFPGEGEIWLQELDGNDWSLKGPRHMLWRGACGGVWAEGPHLYKKDDRYYLVVAEGGTSFNHAVMIAVSDDITGPYQSNPRNPILSSRHLSYDHWVNSTGHADLFELPDGRWYMVLLGIRGDLDRLSNMGRETHLVPVSWEREPFEWKTPRHLWPVASPLSGRVERHYPLPFPDRPQAEAAPFIDHFDGEHLGLSWNFRRVPLAGAWSLRERPGYLRLYARPQIIRERGRAALLGLRQTESDFTFEVAMEFDPSGTSSESGLMVFQKDDNYLGLLLSRQDGGHRLRLRFAERGRAVVTLHENELGDYPGQVRLRLVSDENDYRFSYAFGDSKSFTAFAAAPADSLLSHGYTGSYLGLYSSGNGHDSGDFADFDRVHYAARPRPLNPARP